MSQFSLHVPAPARGQEFDMSDVGTIPEFVPGPIGVQQVQPGTPAARAGLQAGDAIQSVDGHAFHTVQALLAYMQDGQGKPISLTVVRNGAVLPPIVAHPAKLDTEWKLGFAPVPIPFGRCPPPVQCGCAQVGEVLR